MRNNAGRPVGARIREVLEITEARGQANTTEIRLAMKGYVESANVGKYCSRAVGLGLLTADRTQHPIVYRAVDGWREAIDARPPSRRRPEPRPTPQRTWRMANSVFALGAA
ncbi:hypothetical protein [Acidovorax sp. Root70]|uniref:hypothetical protein n=1 Tax=Acidovorax sp. Root70 TaxID=1736590 RepID=UPI0012E39F5D|nr:hypothetical protein [Acidovorax sp. Root70]